MDLLIAVDRGAGRALRDQLYDGLRGAILDGRLPAGARLPATRGLAAGLGLSRFTVADAYGRLVAEGYAVGRHGSGTYVATGAAAVPVPARPVAQGAGAAPEAAGRDRLLSAWGRRALAAAGRPEPEPPLRYDFRQGMPALDAFPFARWRRVGVGAARGLAPADLHYGPTAGLPALRAAIAGYLGRSRGVRCAPGQVVVTSGAQQGLDLLARLWLDPGDAVAMEDPGYHAARRVFAAAGARLWPVPVDGEGLRVDELDGRAPGARLVYATPSHQYPTGGVLPLARRRALLAWARERGALVVEDDYDGEFRYGARPVEALAALDAAGGGSAVAYVGTFSKVLFPGLRLGYLVLPPDLAGAATAAKGIADRHASAHEQATLAAFLAGGHFERHLARMRRLYAARRAAALAALAEDLPGVARRDPAGTAAGLHLLVGFEVPFGEAELVARARAAGVHLDGASPCYADPPARPAVLLGYAALPETAIRAGIRRLAAALGA